MTAKQRKWGMRRLAKTCVPLKAGRAPAKVVTAPASAVPKTPWLSEAEDLLNAVISFVSRALGSMVQGFGALLHDKPMMRLQVLESEGRILSWATLLVTASAIFGALFLAAFRFVVSEPSEWLEGALKTAKVADYLERFLPTLGVGLLVCLVACGPALLMGKQTEVRGPRLLMSTIFAMSLLSSLVTSAIVRYVVIAENGEPVIELLAPLFGTSVSRIWVITGSFCLGVIPVCSASGIALGRTGLGFAFESLPRAWQVLLRATAAVVGAVGGALLPIALFVGVLGAISQAGPLVSKVMAPPSIEQTAEFFPYEPRCVGAEADDVRSLECTLILRTAGKGYVFLDFSQPALIVTNAMLGSSNLHRNRLHESNGIPEAVVESRNLAASTIEPDTSWNLSFVTPSQVSGSVLPVELGKPIVAVLRLHKPCDGEVWTSMQTNQVSWLYLRTRPIQQPSPSSDKFAAIGPWQLPVELFERECRAEPPNQ